MSRSAIFFDRDGVLIRDIDLMTRPDEVELLPGAAAAVTMAKRAGYMTLVATNQSVVARGLCSEADVETVHQTINEALVAAGGEAIDDFRFCPHHPHANDERYRCVCVCRKPSPGMLTSAAAEHDISLGESWLIGDRPTDILAGHRAGCRTVSIRSSMSASHLIVGVDETELVPADLEASDVRSALELILGARRS